MAHSPLATPSATLAVLKRFGLATKKSLGQHFLIDDNVVGRILDLADVVPGDVLIEVGPGIGTLTVALLGREVLVVAVERDTDLLPVLKFTTAGNPNLVVLSADAVTVAPETLAERFGPPTALVANLPYGVAATVVLRLFEEVPSLRSATIMVQAEVADRMAASPGGKEYGSYTVKLRLLARPTGRFAVPRSCFLPPPRVDSAVLRLERCPLSDDPVLLARAARVADSAFAQRRKTLRNSLRSTLGIEVAAIDDALQRCAIDGSLRAERLAPEQFIALAAQLGDQLEPST